MFLSNASVRRPVAMSCLIIALAFLGLNAYRKLGLELMPKIDIPYITIVTVYPGAAPSDIETDIAKKIEDAVSSLDGLKHLTSSCMENVCQTIIEFQLGIDVNIAAMDVREKLDAVLSDFPTGVEKPIIMKFDVNAKAIVTLALSGESSLDELYDYADNTLRDKISTIMGVANVELLGGAEREVNVLLDRKALFSAGLTSLNVAQAISEGIASIPAGRIKEKISEYSVRFDAEYSSVRDIGTLQIVGKDGARRYIQDLGTVVMATEERRQAAFIDSKPCIGIRIVKKADANAVKVVEEIKKAIEKIRVALPGGMDLIWVTDDGDFIQASVDSTSQSIWQGILLTAAILFFFLYSIRTTFVVAITMPLTIIITLLIMQMVGYTLNNPTLLALGLSVGVLVTNSIVVLENIETHLHQGKNSWLAARDGTAEVAVAVIASAGTNIVVLFPIAMMGSLVGLFFKPFAWTTLTVNAVSIFVSFTITPILCAALLRKKENDRSLLAILGKVWNTILQWLANIYGAILAKIAKYKIVSLVVLAIIVGIFINALGLAKEIGFSFVSSTDRGELYVKLEYPTYLHLNETIARVKQVEAKLMKLPFLEHCFSSVGKMEAMLGQTSEAVYLAQLTLKFCEKTKRSLTIHDLLGQIRKEMEFYPDCIVTASIPDIVGGEEIPIQMEIAGEDLEEINRIALSTQKLLEEMDGFLSPDTTVRAGKPEMRIFPQRTILSDIQSSTTSIGMMIRANLEGVKAGLFKSGVRTYDIRVKLQEEPEKKQVQQFQIPLDAQHSMILESYAYWKERKAPVQIIRSDKQRIAKVLSHLRPDFPLGTAVESIIREIEQQAMLPPGYNYNFRGTFEYMAEAVAEFLEAGILAILMTYLALAAILESFTKPFLILTTIPLGLIGMLWSLYLTHETMTIFVLLGGIMLVGIVVNNAILLLDRQHNLKSQGQHPRTAMLNAVKIEFRALLMVTLAAVLGMLPLATSQGLGSELCTGIGISSLGGIAVSATFTMIVVPLLFLLFTKQETSKETPIPQPNPIIQETPPKEIQMTQDSRIMRKGDPLQDTSEDNIRGS